MPDVDRFRRPEQLSLFDPEKILPPWIGLPVTVRKTVIKLMARMFLEHRAHRFTKARDGEGEYTDE